MSESLALESFGHSTPSCSFNFEKTASEPGATEINEPSDRLETEHEMLVHLVLQGPGHCWTGPTLHKQLRFTRLVAETCCPRCLQISLLEVPAACKTLAGAVRGAVAA